MSFGIVGRNTVPRKFLLESGEGGVAVGPGVEVHQELGRDHVRAVRIAGEVGAGVGEGHHGAPEQRHAAVECRRRHDDSDDGGVERAGAGDADTVADLLVEVVQGARADHDLSRRPGQPAIDHGRSDRRLPWAEGSDVGRDPVDRRLRRVEESLVGTNRRIPVQHPPPRRGRVGLDEPADRDIPVPAPGGGRVHHVVETRREDQRGGDDQHPGDGAGDGGGHRQRVATAAPLESQTHPRDHAHGCPRLRESADGDRGSAGARCHADIPRHPGGSPAGEGGAGDHAHGEQGGTDAQDRAVDVDARVHLGVAGQSDRQEPRQSDGHAHGERRPRDRDDHPSDHADGGPLRSTDAKGAELCRVALVEAGLSPQCLTDQDHAGRTEHRGEHEEGVRLEVDAALGAVHRYQPWVVGRDRGAIPGDQLHRRGEVFDGDPGGQAPQDVDVVAGDLVAVVVPERRGRVHAGASNRKDGSLLGEGS